MAAVSAEVQFARSLAGNDKKTREKTVKKLKKWLSSKSPSHFSEDDLLKIWKGLFYCMWMSDKPLVQEELAANISSFVSSFQNVELAFRFTDSFFKTMAKDWYRIDCLRLNKFMMLIRNFVNQCICLTRKLGWDPEVIQGMMNVLRKLPISGDVDVCPLGLQLHVADVFVEELSREANDDFTSECANLFLDPFIQLLAETKNGILIKSVVTRVFEYSMRLSNTEEEKEDETDERLNSEGENEDESSAVDANKNIKKKKRKVFRGMKRKGKKKQRQNHKYKLQQNSYRTLVRHLTTEALEVPTLQLDYTAIADRLFEFGSKPNIRRQNMNAIYRLVKLFRLMAEGIYPLDRVKKRQLGGNFLTAADFDEAAERLLAEEDAAREETMQLKKRKRNKEEIEESDSDNMDSGEDDDDCDLSANGNDDDDPISEQDENEDSEHGDDVGDDGELSDEDFDEGDLNDDDIDAGRSDDDVEQHIPTVENERRAVGVQPKIVSKVKQSDLRVSKTKNKKKKMKMAISEVEVVDGKVKNDSPAWKPEGADEETQPLSSTMSEWEVKLTNNFKTDAEPVKTDVMVIDRQPVMSMKNMTAYSVIKSLNAEKRKQNKLKRSAARANNVPSKAKKGRTKEVSDDLVTAKSVNGNQLKNVLVVNKEKVESVEIISRNVEMQLQKMWANPPAFAKNAFSKLGPKKKSKKKQKVAKEMMGSAKKVNFALFKNTSQDAAEYRKSLQSKSVIPFDGEKKPTQGVLKATPTRMRAADFFPI